MQIIKFCRGGKNLNLSPHKTENTVESQKKIGIGTQFSVIICYYYTRKRIKTANEMVDIFGEIRLKDLELRVYLKKIVFIICILDIS